MYRAEVAKPLNSTGRIVAAGAVRVYLGVESANNNGSGTIGVGVDFKKDFPSTPSSLTYTNQSSFSVNLGSVATINLTTSGVGIQYTVTGTGNAYVYETLTVS